LLAGEPSRISAQLKDVLQDRAARSPVIRESPAWLQLRVAYGSGVTVRELDSVSQVIALVAGIPRPSREVRRALRNLIEWYEGNWPVVEPLLAVVRLRDSCGRVIDGLRELADLAKDL
jgi:hypothetical protein